MIKSVIILVALSAFMCHKDFNLGLFENLKLTSFKEITVSGERRIDLTKLGSLYSDNKYEPLFFFAAPFTFQPDGYLLPGNKFGFILANYKNELHNRKAVRENAKIMETIPELQNLITYNDQYSAFITNFDLLRKEYFVETFRVSGNKTHITLTIKVTANESRNTKAKYSMHFRLIFEIDVKVKEIEEWTEYIINLSDLPKDTQIARQKLQDLYEVERKREAESLKFLNK